MKTTMLGKFGLVLMLLGVLVSMRELGTGTEGAAAFAAAAAPWVLLGLGVACTCAGTFAGMKE